MESDAPRCLRSHVLKSGDQLRLGRRRYHDGGPAHADIDEVLAKEPGAETVW